MKRTPRAGRAAAAGAITVALGFAALMPSAFADQRVASVSVGQGSSTPTVEAGQESGLLDALTGLIGAAANLANNSVSPTVSNNNGQLNIVLDPSNVPGLAEAFTPEVESQLSTNLRGTTAAGNTVVFPTSGTYTSGFGMRWGAMHNGIDIANPIGTPIVSVMDGTVINSGPAQGFGNWIRIKHDDGSVSVYGHMQADQLLVSVGERVKAGQQIAAIGSEGQSTGPHLHFEIHPDGETPVDPQAWFAQQGINF